MNKEYLKELYNNVHSGDVLSSTEIIMVMAYQKIEEYGHNWIGIGSCDKIDATELIELMKKINVKEVYIEREWSNQFDSWYRMQEAGLEIAGVKKIDNPAYQHDIKKWGNSTESETKTVLVFKIKE